MPFPGQSHMVKPPGSVSEEQVYAAIEDVLDPELDESLVKLGFIDRVQVEDDTVTVTFKLPTFWCAPNFAYLMASDLRARVQALPGVRTTRILLLDHCSEEEISSGINEGKSFTEAFPDEAEDNLEELRFIFLRKGFLARQDTLLRQLQKAGVGEDEIRALRVADLIIDESGDCALFAVRGCIIRIERAAKTARVYLRRLATLGISQQPDDLLFVDEHGQPIVEGGLVQYLRQSRSVRMTIMFNTVFCRDMFQTRYGPGGGRPLPEGETV